MVVTDFKVASYLKILPVALALALAGCAGAPRTVGEAAPEPVYQTEWPAPPDPPVIRYVGEIKDLALPKKKRRFKDILGGVEEEGDKTFLRPFAVTTDSQGRVFVGDAELHSVAVFGADGKFKGEWGTAGIGSLNTPLGLAVDSSDNLYVADTVRKRIVVFGPDGRFLRTIGSEGMFENPVGLAVNDAEGLLYVADSRKHQVLVFNLDGTEHSVIQGPFGEGLGSLYFPTSVQIDREGKIWVLDSMNFRVVALDSEGNFIRHFGKLGNFIGDFNRPKGLALDSEGHVYVSDVAFSNVQIFDQEGNLLMFFGNVGGGPGGFAMPGSVHIDGRNRIYVTDQYNRRVQVFEYLGAPEVAAEQTP